MLDDDGINAHPRARGRGQAPEPRSGASKTSGLRSATCRRTIGVAVRCRLHLALSDRSSADLQTRRQHRSSSATRAADRPSRRHRVAEHGEDKTNRSSGLPTAAVEPKAAFPLPDHADRVSPILV